MSPRWLQIQWSAHPDDARQIDSRNVVRISQGGYIFHTVKAEVKVLEVTSGNAPLFISPIFIII